MSLEPLEAQPRRRKRAAPRLGKSLLEKSATTAARWDYELNGDIQPQQVSGGSGDSFHWRCEEAPDHRWEATVTNEKRSPGCRFCAGLRASSTNNLTISNPLTSALWDEDLNGDLRPEHVLAGSKMKVHWRCPRGEDHQWVATINDQRNSPACRFCSGRYASSTCNLRLTDPQVADLWDAELNGNLGPDHVTSGSTLVVNWICGKNKDHKWKLPVEKQAVQGADCRFCMGRKASATSNLVITNALVASRWNYELNNDLLPEYVTANSNRTVHWVCEKNPEHRWEATVISQTLGGSCLVLQW